MTVWISLELLFFNFERLDISCASIAHPCQKWRPSALDLSFRVHLRASLYIMCLKWTSEWKVMTIWFSRELPFLNFKRLDISLASFVHPCQKLWPFEFLESFRCSISSVSISYAPESDLRVKSYDHLNFSRASVVKFRASRYIIHLNRTPMSNVLAV